VTSTDCPYHATTGEVVAIDAGETFVLWCPFCGAICDNNGEHDAPPGQWRAPDGVVLPGWKCKQCGSFNGCAKELLPDCRSCGVPRVA
jgi:hypothetical protein